MRSQVGAARLFAYVVVFSILYGCVSPTPLPGSGGKVQRSGAGGIDIDAVMARNRLMQEMMTNPDLPAWQEQREKMALAVGDRMIDKNFERTFDSMIIALANLGCRVNNMERISGYITASLPQLPPDQRDALRKEALAQYLQTKGYSASALESHGRYDADYSALFGREMGVAGLTLTMSKQGVGQTKVKLRFDSVYYPRTVEELYKRVWDAVDKQIFLDKSIG
jgi:hypothetical protein